MKRSNTVTYELNQQRLEPLTAVQKAELDSLAAMPDGQIDTSEVPPLSETFWKNAARNPFYRPLKRDINPG